MLSGTPTIVVCASTPPGAGIAIDKSAINAIRGTKARPSCDGLISKTMRMADWSRVAIERKVVDDSCRVPSWRIAARTASRSNGHSMECNRDRLLAFKTTIPHSWRGDPDPHAETPHYLARSAPIHCLRPTADIHGQAPRAAASVALHLCWYRGCDDGSDQSEPVWRSRRNAAEEIGKRCEGRHQLAQCLDRTGGPISCTHITICQHLDQRLARSIRRIRRPHKPPWSRYIPGIGSATIGQWLIAS